MNADLRGNITETLSAIAGPFLDLIRRMKTGKIAIAVQKELTRLTDLKVCT